MHSLVAYTLLASATLSLAIDPRFEFPDTVPLVKRQQPGTPQYACHEDCGLLITIAREEKDFCESDEWTSHYDKCMECANTYGIWKYYGEGISRVAKQCDLSPSPSPSGAAAAEQSTSAVATTEAEVTSAVAESTVSITTIQPVVTTHDVSATQTHATPNHDYTSIDEIGTVGATANSTPKPSSVPVNSAAKHFDLTTAVALTVLAIISLY
ncbi:hypothetical protein NW752_005894 [Fusarium irregulare]|uniref:Uncharacterized protein n=1 Tax=Fusarium irregulare TaxID=2494466 RepID=A0A9W8UAJ1_9HYPO|nr:hypothetical protein NW766_006427 [Fusarium irregulare]KAJ4018766.1 hypothetical protein NW752_005894 [Fusarium irregulare]